MRENKGKRTLCHMAKTECSRLPTKRCRLVTNGCRTNHRRIPANSRQLPASRAASIIPVPEGEKEKSGFLQTAGTTTSATNMV